MPSLEHFQYNYVKYNTQVQCKNVGRVLVVWFNIKPMPVAMTLLHINYFIPTGAGGVLDYNPMSLAFGNRIE